jgi:hypothetical protein
VKILAVPSGHNQGSEVQEVPYVERYPPDTTAAIFWLKNRQREKWRDRITSEMTGPNDGPVETVNKVEISLVRP